MNASNDSRSPLARAVSAVMVCNPFLLLSPMCLLYGIYRAVTMPTLFATDTGNTIFNFVALALYVLMVCVTATLLARKRIMPDTMMLLILHALLFVAPFILIAHGVFLDGPVALALGLGGIGCGVAQLYLLRRRLTETFVSPQLIMGGALILIVNFAAPMLFRQRLENSNEAWTMAGTYAWNLILPALVAWMNFLPSQAKGELLWGRTWFGLLTYFLWIAGTTIQLWTVSYVDDRAVHVHQFAVAAWVLAWTALRRAGDLPRAGEAVAGALAPGAVFLIPAVGALYGLDLNIACALYALNVPLLFLKFGNMPTKALAGLSLTAALCCMPLDWMRFLVPTVERAHFIAITLGALLLGCFAILRDARAGFLGAIVVAIGIGAGTDYSATVALNGAVLFLFLHQLRWPTFERDEKLLLGLAGGIWVLHTLNLDLAGVNEARIAPFVATIVATICLRNASVGLNTSLIPPICSIVVLLIHPLHRGVVTVAKAPSGALAIVLGFVLLGAGAWHALRRSRQSELVSTDEERSEES